MTVGGTVRDLYDCLLTIPHPRQWCRQQRTLNGRQQIIQVSAGASTRQIGAHVKSAQLVSADIRCSTTTKYTVTTTNNHLTAVCPGQPG